MAAWTYSLIGAPGNQPSRPEENAVERNAFHEEPGCDEARRAKMMTLQPGIVGEDLARSQENRGPAQWPVFWLIREQHRREADAVFAEFPSDLAGLFQPDLEKPPVRLQAADLFAHGLGEIF